MRVFISWSGERSRIVAEALREWLPMVLQFVDPWMSAADLEKGAHWPGQISEQLGAASVGISCLTPENLNAPWLLFEAGALSKQVERTRLFTVLTDLRPQDVPPPLGLFQHTVVGRSEISRLIHAINRLNIEKPLPDQRLDGLLETAWPKLQAQITRLPKVPDATRQRPPEEILAEILEISRRQAGVADCQNILAKLNCIELAMILLSVHKQGIPIASDIAWTVIKKSHQFYDSPNDKLQEALVPVWDQAQEIMLTASRGLERLNSARSRKVAGANEPGDAQPSEAPGD